MIQIKEEKITELMFGIWRKSNDLKNPVMVGEYITKEIVKVKNLTIHDVNVTEEKLQAMEDLKDLCYDVCPLDRRDDLSEIIARL